MNKKFVFLMFLCLLMFLFRKKITPYEYGYNIGWSSAMKSFFNDRNLELENLAVYSSYFQETEDFKFVSKGYKEGHKAALYYFSPKNKIR